MTVRSENGSSVNLDPTNVGYRRPDPLDVDAPVGGEGIIVDIGAVLALLKQRNNRRMLLRE